MLKVVIESPFGRNPDGSKCTPEEYERNRVYALRCIKHSLSLGEAPFASHLFYPQVLDDTNEEEREHGIMAGFAWGDTAERCVVYTDYGITEGMSRGAHRRAYLMRTETRSIGKNP